MDFLTEAATDARKHGIDRAVAVHDTPTIFDWLLTSFSFQGVSDQVAQSYMEANGTASWTAMADFFKAQPVPSCGRLRSYWRFADCRYDKTSFSCSEPDHIHSCLVPRPKLRNGRLNQTAVSFFLFVRDIADGNLVGWIDTQLAGPAPSATRPASIANQEMLIGPLRHVYGVSDKILTMTLSGLLLGASAGRPNWFEAGKAMIAIDSLVHAFLHRTGILDDCGSPHAYGVGCYAKGGCADIVRSAASAIDARKFNRNYPQTFPRFVQHAIWQFCAADGLDLCNGNRIDDRKACQIAYCQLYQKCHRKPLKTP